MSCPLTTLTPGQSTTCTKTYTLTQADVDAGHVANTATATGTPPAGLTAPTASDSTDTLIAAGARITLDKFADPAGTGAGSTIRYWFVMTNTGNVTLTNVGVVDPKVGPVTCSVTTIAPTVTTTCSKLYTLTQADVDAGVINNTATASGTPPVGAVVSATDSNAATITRSPAITLDKQAGTPSGASAGSTILYSFVVTNTGNVTLNPISVTDPKVGAITCPVTNLAPAATTTCTKSYPITQADVDSGHVANTATATGTPPSGLTAPTASDSTDTTIVATPRITLDKQGGTPTGNTAGSTIAYSFVLTNTGNVSLSSVGVADPKVGPVTCPVTTLAPNATTTCTKTYAITQADVNAGTVNNTATASGSSPTAVVVTATDSVVTPIVRTTSITLDKQASEPTGAAAGSTIGFSFVVTNTGNVTLNPISVTDPLVGAITCPITNLAPAATTTCTKSYTITQPDVDSGHVANTATATGTPPAGVSAPTATDSTDTALRPAAAITLDKQAGAPTGTTAGSTITYSFVVTNTGNVTLGKVEVSDPLVGTVTCPESVLSPGLSMDCTATYKLTQEDVNKGVVVNEASASGAPPSGDVVSATDSTTTPITTTAALTLDKEAAKVSGNVAGSTIEYSFVVTNKGEVTLAPVTVTDPLFEKFECSIEKLGPGESFTCSATYTLTQADVDAGRVVNEATATGTPPKGDDVTATDNTETAIEPNPVITLDKSAGTPSGTTPGSTISYEFAVSNTGNVTLDPVTVSDSKVAVDCPERVLAPSATMTCSATYVLTQSDVDAGQVENSASASGAPPVGKEVGASDVVVTPIARVARLTLDKQAGTPSGSAVGSTIAYNFVVTNTGNVTPQPGVGERSVGRHRHLSRHESRARCEHDLREDLLDHPTGPRYRSRCEHGNCHRHARHPVSRRRRLRMRPTPL